MSAKRLTLQDIADEAGVSLTTASLYINGKAKRYKLAEATCARIQQVMDAHHFTPNLHARAIASKKTFLVGVILSQELEASFWLNILSGLEVTLARSNYHMLLSVSHGNAKAERESIRFMRTKGVDGLIISPVSGNLKELVKGLPTVTLNRQVDGVPGVWNENLSGGRKAASFLLENGHRRIACIGELNRSVWLRLSNWCRRIICQFAPSHRSPNLWNTRGSSPPFSARPTIFFWNFIRRRPQSRCEFRNSFR